MNTGLGTKNLDVQIIKKDSKENGRLTHKSPSRIFEDSVLPVPAIDKPRLDASGRPDFDHEHYPPPLISALNFANHNCHTIAEQKCLNFIDQNKERYHGYLVLALVYLKGRDFKKALHWLTFVEDRFKEIPESVLIFLLEKKVEAHTNYYEFENAVSAAVKLSSATHSKKHLLTLAEALRDTERLDDALSVYQALVNAGYHRNTNKIAIALILKNLGRVDEAVDVLNDVKRLSKWAPRAYLELANLKTYRFSDDEIKTMTAIANDITIDVNQYIYIHLALGKAEEDRRRYRAAFNYYQNAKNVKAAKARREPYDPEQVETVNNQIKKTLHPGHFANYASSGVPKAGPIFVLGMHRSGSTLIEQILSTHSAIDGTKELPNIPRMVKQLTSNAVHSETSTPDYSRIVAELTPQQKHDLGEQYLRETAHYRKAGIYFVDKKPQNFQYIGLILSILPQAKIIDVRRHPLAYGVGIYRQFFTKKAVYTNRLYDIGHYYREYVRLMDHWQRCFPGKIFYVQYEKLVANTEHVVRGLLNHCQIPFEERCLQFYNNERPVFTPSAQQVRQPIYTSSLDTWKGFEPFIDDLKQGLKDALHDYDRTNLNQFVSEAL